MMFRRIPGDMVDTLKSQRDVAARYCNASTNPSSEARKTFICNDRRFDGLDANKLIELLDWNRDGGTAITYIKENLN